MMRRVQRTLFGLAIGIAGLAALLPGEAIAGPICPNGSFRVQGPFLESLGVEDGDIITMRDFHVALAGCEPERAKVREIAGGVRLRARWRPCEALGGRVRLKMDLDASCQTAKGKVVVVGKLRRRFKAESVVPAPTFTVDPSVAPESVSLERYADGQPRPLAAVTDSSGVPLTFVENELLVVSDDADAVVALARRWRGRILMDLAPRDYGLDLPTHWLVRIDTDLGDRAKLAADLKALNPESSGALRVSSEAALGLVGAAASEAAGGLQVGMNFVLGGDTYRDRSITEGNPGRALSNSEAWSPNPFQWSYFRRGGNQNIGVGEAWRALDLAVKLGTQVKIAVLDGGFGVGEDFPSSWEHHDNSIHAMDPTRANENSCTNDAPCPWHGQNAVNAAMGVADNRFGAAGPAGPVAKAVTVRVSGDAFNYLGAYLIAFASGAEIVTMSMSGRVPAVVSWIIEPLNALTALMRLSGVTFFASAGNLGENVDEKDCFLGVCWEESWTVPCENDGVICVGALAVDSKTRRRDSNWGPENVDMFGPGELWVAPDPADPQVHTFGATSAATPFVAGVAALMKAANERLTPADIERILIESGNPSPDGTVKTYVNAYEAVLRALGSTPPEISIREDRRVSQTFCGPPEQFLVATATDREDGIPASIEWFSDVDGRIGTGLEIRPSLSRGTHRIHAVATDSIGVATTSTAITMVVDYAITSAEIDIVSPEMWAEIPKTKAINFEADGRDWWNCGGANALRDARVTWMHRTVRNDGSFRDVVIGTGRRLTATLSTPGVHTIFAFYQYGDRAEERVYDVISIVIDDVRIDTPPTMTIVRPLARDVTVTITQTPNGFLGCLYVEGTGRDAETPNFGSNPYSIWWESNRYDLYAGGWSSPQWFFRAGTICLRPDPRTPNGTEHRLTLRGLDSAGNEGVSPELRVLLVPNLR